MIALASEVTYPLLAHVTSARWFAGKGRDVTLVGRTPLPWLTSAPDSRGASGPAVRMEVVEVAYSDGPGGPGGDREIYQLALAYRSTPQPSLRSAEVGRWTDAELGPVVVYDATQDPEASAVVLRALLAEDRLRHPEAELAFHLSGDPGLRADLPPSVFRGQQSNTSVMFGEMAMLKLFRRLELGRNLDIEVHDALSRTGTADVARLFGWARASWSGTHPVTGRTETLQADLAMVVELLAEATDGWTLAVESLTPGRSFVDPARALGAALAETHAALRRAFPTGTRPGREVAAVMAGRLDVAAGIAPALAPHVAGLRSVYGALADRELPVQRVHGDFHLGQTLLTPNGVKIIDFEGEPVKTLAERAAPDSVWRDIAGMLRSLDYAAASVPGPGAQTWADGCREAFLAGYAGGEPAAGDAAVLRAYEADKAVYEVVYEVRNRPDWAAIPLAAVAALTDVTGTGDGSGTRGAAAPSGADNLGEE